jgi:hypothetical protein
MPIEDYEKETTYRWRVSGSRYFSPFWVAAPNMRMALAHASDILAGADHKGKRYYGTVENHITSIVREEK